ncbi:MAG: hypothetical protein ABI263_05525 [Gelidibacter sp.]
MNFLRQHIVFKAFTLIIVVTLLLPSAVKFMHIFEKHQHEVCYGEAASHFHTLDIDCEFYKFKLNIPFIIPEKITFLIPNIEINNAPTKDYSFLSDYQRLHFSLRGPPQLI